MQDTPITFEGLPSYVYQLGRKIDDLTTLLRSQSERSHPIADRWFSIEELSDYLPGNPAVTTLYGKVQRREIPFSRTGKRLAFRQSDIDLWLQSGRVKTGAEIEAQAEERLNSRKTKTR